jgi:hypothetical protein
LTFVQLRIALGSDEWLCRARRLEWLDGRGSGDPFDPATAAVPWWSVVVRVVPATAPVPGEPWVRTPLMRTHTAYLPVSRSSRSWSRCSVMAVLSGLAYESLGYVRRAREVTQIGLRPPRRDRTDRAPAGERLLHDSRLDPGARRWSALPVVPALLAGIRAPPTSPPSRAPAGWNAAGLPRSTLQRVTWRLDGTRLIREHAACSTPRSPHRPCSDRCCTHVGARSICGTSMRSATGRKPGRPRPSAGPTGAAAVLGDRRRSRPRSTGRRPRDHTRRLVEVPRTTRSSAESRSSSRSVIVALVHDSLPRASGPRARSISAVPRRCSWHRNRPIQVAYRAEDWVMEIRAGGCPALPGRSPC